MATKLVQGNPLALPVYPKPSKTIIYTPTHTAGVSENTIDYSTVSGLLLALLIASVICNLYQRRRKIDVYERTEQPRESITDIIRRCEVPTRSQRPVSERNPRSRIQQLYVSQSEHRVQRRDGRERYTEDIIPDRARHPRGSAIEAWARHLQTKAKG